MCLPSETFPWIESGNIEPIKAIVEKDLVYPEHLKFVLMPLHFPILQHWGLICLDLDNATVSFDDGLKKNPPTHLSQIIGALIRLLRSMFPSVKTFRTTVSSQVSFSFFKRMGMPQQMIDRKTVGGGSCGMGVILLAQDIIRDEIVPPNQITWTFERPN